MGYNVIGVGITGYCLNVSFKAKIKAISSDTHLGKKQLSGVNNLVSCQVEGRRMQYLRCGNLWRNIGKNRKDCIWYL